MQTKFYVHKEIWLNQTQLDSEWPLKLNKLQTLSMDADVEFKLINGY